jgi:hypothetical protein
MHLGQSESPLLQRHARFFSGNIVSGSVEAEHDARDCFDDCTQKYFVCASMRLLTGYRLLMTHLLRPPHTIPVALCQQATAASTW